jgi:hypothetical protein
MYRTAWRQNFRICHISLQTGHMHLVVEADDYLALARGMQGFQISCAKRLNAVISCRTGTRRRGRVFADRYHARIQRSPRQVRATVGYVLGNWRRHGADATIRSAPRIDPYSSAPLFDGWSHRTLPPVLAPPVDPLPVSRPRTWLLATGWRSLGLLDPDAVPGPPA